MTFGLVLRANHRRDPIGEAVSHLAELVRGYYAVLDRRPPHSPLRGTFSPRGEGHAVP
jgi:hypothetical protein